MTITSDLPPDVAEALTHKAAEEGREVAGSVQQLAVRDTDDRAGKTGETASRTPGLHAGQYWSADDFDAPLLT